MCAYRTLALATRLAECVAKRARGKRRHARHLSQVVCADMDAKLFFECVYCLEFFAVVVVHGLFPFVPVLYHCPSALSIPVLWIVQKSTAFLLALFVYEYARCRGAFRDESTIAYVHGISFRASIIPKKARPVQAENNFIFRLTFARFRGIILRKSKNRGPVRGPSSFHTAVRPRLPHTPQKEGSRYPVVLPHEKCTLLSSLS